jgi:hypothetical protein
VPQAAADALLLAAENPDLRTRAAGINLERLSRAEVNLVRSQMEVFYQRLPG